MTKFKRRYNKQYYNRVRQNFLLTFFDQPTDQHEEKEVNGFWLIKTWNGDTGRWQVSIYSQESYRAYKGNNGRLPL